MRHDDLGRRGAGFAPGRPAGRGVGRRHRPRRADRGGTRPHRPRSPRGVRARGHGVRQPVARCLRGGAPRWPARRQHDQAAPRGQGARSVQVPRPGQRGRHRPVQGHRERARTAPERLPRLGRLVLRPHRFPQRLRPPVEHDAALVPVHGRAGAARARVQRRAHRRGPEPARRGPQADPARALPDRRHDGGLDGAPPAGSLERRHGTSRGPWPEDPRRERPGRNRTALDRERAT